MPNGGGVPEYFYSGAPPAGVPRLGARPGMQQTYAQGVLAAQRRRSAPGGVGIGAGAAPAGLLPQFPGGGSQPANPLLALAGGIPSWLLPILGGLLGGTALGNIFGGMTDIEPGGGQMARTGEAAGLGDAGAFWPWETPEGEGFIAPWTPQTLLPSGAVGQIGKAYPSEGIAYTWSTNPANPEAGWIFYRLTNGKIGTFTKKGIWKEWRPQKHIVVSRNPRMGTLISATKRLDKMNNRLGKIFRKKTSRRMIEPALKYLSPVERKAIKA